MFYSLSHPNNWRLKKDIQDLIDESLVKSKRKRPKANEELTAKQKIIILHYLDIIPQIDLPDIKKAKLLSKLLDRNEQDIRDYIGHVNGRVEKSEIKTKANLEFVRSIFQDLEMDDQIALVDNDLSKFDKIE